VKHLTEKKKENHIKGKLIVFLICYWFQFLNQSGCDVSIVSNSAKFEEDNKTKTNQSLRGFNTAFIVVSLLSDCETGNRCGKKLF